MNKRFALWRGWLLLPVLFTACHREVEIVHEPVDWVDPFIGTGAHGHTYPGPSLPFGMVQLSPDTRLTGWDGCSGYHYSDSVIYGFSHTHLSGTGIPDYADILLMPMTGPVRLNNGSDSPGSGYGEFFSHKEETASPGHYGVRMKSGIEVELTVTQRAGFHRIRFPGGKSAHVICDLTHRDPVLDSFIRKVNDRELAGYRRSSSWARDQWVFFVIRFSRPFQTLGLYDHDMPVPGVDLRGRHVKSVMTFDGTDSELLVKVGLSAVDEEGARRNLDAEIPHWDFDRVHDQAREIWARSLGRIRVSGGTPSQFRVFYTALYHALLNPNLYMDVDGRYRGMDQAVHKSDRHTHYTVFSLWDTFRAAHPLLTILEPDRTLDFIRTLLIHYKQGGRLPMWELAANYTGCMIGYHAVSVIADAYFKGLRDFDTPLALEAMMHSAELDHLGLDMFKEQGFISMDAESESVSKTLEYAYDDWCIARMAEDLGLEDAARRYRLWAQSYKNLYDASTGFMRPRLNGGWLSPFDPREVSFNYTEANAWQYSFFAPQDVEGLMALMGGEEAFIRKLDALFDEISETTGRDQADITGLIGQYAHGNEPSHHMAYLYAYAGRPWKTQKRVRQIMNTLYDDSPEGLCGNEDCGQMSAWLVLSALGFYPVQPGKPEYVLGSPWFEKAVLHLDNGKTFTIQAPGNSRNRPYVRSMKLNQKNHSSLVLAHEAIMAGGDLEFTMSRRPDKRNWAPSWRPRSSIDEPVLVPVPVIQADARTFSDSMRVTVSGLMDDAVVYYTLDGREPGHQDAQAAAPFWIYDHTLVRARARHPVHGWSAVVTAEYTRHPPHRRVEIETPYSPQYTGGGDEALIDLIRGGNNFKNGAWQGYEGIDFQAVVDLGSVQEVRGAGAGFLQDAGSWIWMPDSVVIEVSRDGVHFSRAGRVVNTVADTAWGGISGDFMVELPNVSVRYIRVHAHNRSVVPEWHVGAGGKAWIFVDEILVE
ncbi:MAG TPA: glycoside hydrolase family 92 protein [bacterium]|nr:glycoside hydrolase family 92 protein [bacterium]